MRGGCTQPGVEYLAYAAYARLHGGVIVRCDVCGGNACVTLAAYARIHAAYMPYAAYLALRRARPHHVKHASHT